MIEQVYLQGMPDSPMSMDKLFAYKIRFQVLVDTEDQFDYMTALQLMYGREIELDTWAGWHEKKNALMATRKQELRLLPMWFTTTPVTIKEI